MLIWHLTFTVSEYGSIDMVSFLLAPKTWLLLVGWCKKNCCKRLEEIDNKWTRAIKPVLGYWRLHFRICSLSVPWLQLTHLLLPKTLNSLTPTRYLTPNSDFPEPWTFPISPHLLPTSDFVLTATLCKVVCELAIITCCFWCQRASLVSLYLFPS